MLKTQKSRKGLLIEIQAHLVLLCLSLLHFTDVLFIFLKMKARPPPAKRLLLTSLRCSIYCGGWKTKPTIAPSQVGLYKHNITL